MDDFKKSKFCFWEVPGKWLGKIFILAEKKGLLLLPLLWLILSHSDGFHKL